VTTEEKKFTRNSPEPKNLQEAMAMPDSQMWKDAVIKELTSLRDIGHIPFCFLAQREVVRPLDVYDSYSHENWTVMGVSKYKARCVLKGYRQREGVDYNEVFSPTPQFISFRIMPALDNHHDWAVPPTV
jgi:hypothetical protein